MGGERRPTNYIIIADGNTQYLFPVLQRTACLKFIIRSNLAEYKSPNHLNIICENRNI